MKKLTALVLLACSFSVTLPASAASLGFVDTGGFAQMLTDPRAPAKADAGTAFVDTGGFAQMLSDPCEPTAVPDPGPGTC